MTTNLKSILDVNHPRVDELAKKTNSREETRTLNNHNMQNGCTDQPCC